MKYGIVLAAGFATATRDSSTRPIRFHQDKSRKQVPAQPVDATPPDINLFPERWCFYAETMEALFGSAG